MSYPARNNKDYGYFPNNADGVADLESSVTTSGVSMSGITEKHSEFMEPNNQSYNDMEYKYPYPTTVEPMDPVWPVSAGYNWPSGLEPESFKCVAVGCCCEGNSTKINVVCTYPIIKGPWLRSSEGDTFFPKIGKDGKNSRDFCMQPTVGNCPPDIRCVIQSPAQGRYPGRKMELRASWIEESGCACPPTSVCCTGVSIGIASTQMNVGTSQTLSVVNPVGGCSYEFRLISGGGELKGATYYAPAANASCLQNPTIGLYADCVLCKSVTISVTNPGVSGIAYNVVTLCDFTPPFAGQYYCCAQYNCAGQLVTGTGSIACNAPSTPGYACSGLYPADTATKAWNYGTSSPECVDGDVRTTEMKEQGCCPAIA